VSSAEADEFGADGMYDMVEEFLEVDVEEEDPDGGMN